MFLKRIKVCFKGGQCLIPFVGLGEHVDRTRAKHGVEEFSTDSELCFCTQASLCSLFFSFFFFFFPLLFSTNYL